jgi:signal recognition particle subunit SRP54
MAQPGLVQKMMGMLGGPMAEMNKMMQDEDTEGSIRQTVGIINSMTVKERRDTGLLNQSRRQRIAEGAGVQVTEVTQLIKQYDQMKPMMEGMAGKGVKDRIKSIREMQQSAMSGSQGAKKKQSTGRRLSAAEKKKNRQARMKKLKRFRGR